MKPTNRRLSLRENSKPSCFQNLSFVSSCFFGANILFVLILNYGIDNSLQFLLLSSGVILFSFFLRRIIHQMIGL